ncbi:hypothetical protein HHI36_021293 [Cryptolaemus montrouzieri]|uniref:Uncharacterized protein n=1 Tax=Cryptolaemus montrouzieri TaxID=559131 RepID=A0ABD2MWS7_9CUCU
MNERFLNISQREENISDDYHIALKYRRRFQRGGVNILCKDEDFSVLDDINVLSEKLLCEPVSEHVDIWNCDFRDHRAQRMTMNLIGESTSYITRKIRPLTGNGLNSFHSILEQLSWDFFDNDLIIVDDAFNTFHQSFVDERVIRERKSDQGVHWLSDDLRSMRLRLVTKLYDKYATDNLKFARNRLRLLYKLQINKATIGANDKTILLSSNRQGAMWNIITTRRNSPKNKISSQLPPNDFNEYFTSVPPSITKKVSDGVAQIYLKV